MGSVRKSLKLSMIDSYSGIVLQLVSTMIIARILTPKDIGIVAVAAVFSGLATVIRDFGVAEYFIQEKDLSSEKISAALMVNIASSWTMALAMLLGSFPVARFYNDVGVGNVMRIQALGFLMVPFGAVTMAYFRRMLDMRPVLMANLVGSLTSFVVSISMVLLGFGYISIPWGGVIGIATTVGMSIWYRPSSFPKWPGIRGTKTIVKYSSFASMVYIARHMAKSLPEMIIGRVQSLADVAIFSRANGMVELFNRLAMRPVMSICMPYFAKSDREHNAISKAYIQSVSFLTVAGWPFLGFMGLAAFFAIRLIYGPQWDASVPYAKILCLAGAIELSHAMSREALLAKGLAKKAQNLQLIMLACQAIGLLFIFWGGLGGAAWGLVAASAASFLISMRMLSEGIGLRASELLRACGQSLLVTAGALAPAAIWNLLVPLTPANMLFFGIGGAALTAGSWIVMLTLSRHPLLGELRHMVNRKRGVAS